MKNDKGEIISAGSIVMRWAVAVNQSVIQGGKASSDGTGEVVDATCLEWEKQWTELMKNVSKSLPQGINIYFHNSRRYDLNNNVTLDY